MNQDNQRGNLSRRKFFRIGGILAAGTTIGCKASQGGIKQDQEESKKIKSFRRLGRTGFKVSDISMGTTRLNDQNVVRYAYDHGVNYFDTAEGYGNGQSERFIGQTMPFMDREKIFITTKLHIDEQETEQSIIERFSKCQERLQTEYVDCLYMHGVTRVDLLNHAAFHSAVKKLKSDGRLRFIGLSSHGPYRKEDDSMEKVLVAAAEDGRFDVMLLIYNFLNQEAGENILAACKKNDVGTTAMKISPGFVKVDDFDPENPTSDQQNFLRRMMDRGMSREDAEARLKSRIENNREELQKYKPFFDKYNVKTEAQLREATIRWVLENPDMHTVCVSMRSFDTVEQVVPVSGTAMSSSNRKFLEDYQKYLGSSYCRHACNICLNVCPRQIPVSTIMRYAYYYAMQGREKYAMEKYSALANADADVCLDCEAPCIAACPHQVDARASLQKAHDLLSLA